MKLSLVAVALAALAGCATEPATPPKAAAATPAPMASPAPAAAPMAAAAPAATAQVFFAVLPETGRIHAFGDTKNYFDFLSHGEVTLTRTQIGAGPGGRTVVYGITGDDVKANKPSLGELVMNGSATPAPGFYGEVLKDSRYYVFGDLKDMKNFLAFGEVPYSYTDIGVGPKGESLVYVMNKDSYAKGKPADRGERFKSLRMAAK
ncbi:MAG: hypothetical protein Q8K45_05820 [Rubrivivax sp.]|nr:hypothetical protein [Rubrivivax sp.]